MFSEMKSQDAKEAAAVFIVDLLSESCCPGGTYYDYEDENKVVIHSVERIALCFQIWPKPDITHIILGWVSEKNCEQSLLTSPTFSVFRFEACDNVNNLICLKNNRSMVFMCQIPGW